MKFDPFNWHEVKANEKVQARKGWLRLRCSAAAPVFIEAEGHEVLLGVGTSFDVETSEAVNFRVEAPKGTRVFMYRPFGTSVESEGEVFTNIDRMPQESGAVAEVTKALRLFKVQQNALLRQVRAERNALEAVKAKAEAASAPAPAAEPDPAPVPQPDPAPAPALEPVKEAKK